MTTLAPNQASIMLRCTVGPWSEPMSNGYRERLWLCKGHPLEEVAAEVSQNDDGRWKWCVTLPFEVRGWENGGRSWNGEQFHDGEDDAGLATAELAMAEADAKLLEIMRPDGVDE